MKLIILVMLFGLIGVFSAFSSGTEEKEAMDYPGASTTASASPSAGSPVSQDMTTGGLVTETNFEEARMQAKETPVVLFFNATWCPTCRAAVADIASRQEELGDITVFLVDYDGERELKRRYGVTMQHTFVQIDANGEAVTLWNGGGINLILHNVVVMERG